MSYFYATRRDKSGNKLVTSYGKRAQAEKYGGADAVISNENFYLSADGKPTKEASGLILRSKLECDAGASGSGPFVLYVADGEKFVPTSHRFDSYGAANNGMKALAPALGTMLVVEENWGKNEQQVTAYEEAGDPF